METPNLNLTSRMKTSAIAQARHEVPMYYSLNQSEFSDGTPDVAFGPDITLDPEHELFAITGISDSIFARDFFEGVLEWLSVYENSPVPDQNMRVQLEYFNTASSLMLLRIFRRWLRIHPGNSISWVYRDGDTFIEEAGEEYKSILNHRFRLVTIHS